jgi:hypothetical protein
MFSFWNAQSHRRKMLADASCQRQNIGRQRYTPFTRFPAKEIECGENNATYQSDSSRKHDNGFGKRDGDVVLTIRIPSSNHSPVVTTILGHGGVSYRRQANNPCRLVVKIFDVFDCGALLDTGASFNFVTIEEVRGWESIK